MRPNVPESDALALIRSGRQESLDTLVSLLYPELREAAHRQLRKGCRADGASPTLATTALVNEAYLKLVDQTRATWRDRAHFLAIAAVTMRHILVDGARARLAAKRGGSRPALSLAEELVPFNDDAERILEIDDALGRLAALNPRLAHVVEAHYFAGFTEEEIAAALQISTRTVQRDLKKADMLLGRLLAASA